VVQNSNNGSIGDGTARIRERAEARRLSILRAAARAFRRHGFAATGMREIAAEAGLSPGNLYHYFNGKHELLFFCQDRSLSLMLESLEAARLSGGPLRDQVHAVLVAHTRCLLDEMEGSAAHLAVDALPPQQRKAIVTKRDRYEKGLSDLVEQGVRAGEFAACDPRLVTRALLGAANWTAGWFRPDGTKSAATVAEETADFLVRGLDTHPVRRRAAQRERRDA